MKTITIDISSKENLLTDVQNNTISLGSGNNHQCFCLHLLENGQPWQVPEDAALSVWYSGPSGEGSYTQVDGESAFSVSGNAVTVTVAPEMVAAAGSGFVCLMIHTSNGKQRKLWNLIYTVEGIPGEESPKLSGYFAAFSGLIRQAQEFLYEQAPDSSLSVAGKAADAAATGAALAGKAPEENARAVKFIIPAGSSRDIGFSGETEALITCRSATSTGYGVFLYSGYSAGSLRQNLKCLENGGIPCALNPDNTAQGITICNPSNTNTLTVCVRVIIGSLPAITASDAAQENVYTEYDQPPMLTGVEYRTTKRHNGKPVYRKSVFVGAMPNATSMSVEHGIENVDFAFPPSGCMVHSGGNNVVSVPYFESVSNCIGITLQQRNIVIVASGNASGFNGTIHLEYTKSTD